MTDSRDSLSEVPAHGPEGLGDAHLPHTVISRPIDGLIEGFGQLSGWLWPVLMMVIIINVVSRYVFSEGLIQLEELQWHIYSFGFLIALSWAVLGDSHVRVDLLRERFSLRTQAVIELLGMTLLLMPFAAVLMYYAWPWVVEAWEVGESSRSAGGLSDRWIVKSSLLLGMGLLLLATLSRLTRLVAFLMNGEVRHAD